MELKEIQAALPENVLNAIGVLADFGFDVFTSAKLEDVTDLKTGGRRATWSLSGRYDLAICMKAVGEKPDPKVHTVEEIVAPVEVQDQVATDLGEGEARPEEPVVHSGPGTNEAKRKKAAPVEEAEEPEATPGTDAALDLKPVEKMDRQELLAEAVPIDGVPNPSRQKSEVLRRVIADNRAGQFDPAKFDFNE
jgi:hypothetical protein